MNETLTQARPAVAGAAKGSIYTTLIPITKANASTEGTCWKLGKA